MTGVVLGVLLVGLVACLQPVLAPTPMQASQAEVIKALRERAPSALVRAQQHHVAFPDDVRGLALYADVAALQSQHQLAIELFTRLLSSKAEWKLHGHLGLARRYEILGQLELAEQHLRHVLEIAPHHLEAHGRLGRLLQIEGRTWESLGHHFIQLRKGACQENQLLGMVATERFMSSDERLERVCREKHPKEVVIKLVATRRALFDSRPTDAQDLLREILAIRPDLGEAQGRMGRIIVDRGDAAEFLRWLAKIPDKSKDHPEVWFVQGIQARRQGNMPGAVHCFLQTLHKSPNHLGANVQIAGCLQRLGRTEAATEFARRGELLAQLDEALNLVRLSTDPRFMADPIPLLGQLGRYWEAAGWCHVMLSKDGSKTEFRRDMMHWLRLARAEVDVNAPSQLPARLLKRTDFPSPDWPTATETKSPPESAPIRVDWRFVNDAERLGIHFQYYEGTTEATRLKHIFNTFGGGLGVIDFDLDGWPDLYLAQANDWRNPRPQAEFRDRLYRNQTGERFLDITDLAWLNEPGFSHGVSVGDFDQDGFADIYIGNKGPNRLFRNNGDGTFDDVTALSGTAGNEWSTSSAFADFNSDGLPDLFVLNYSRLKETAEKECLNREDQPVACSPDVLVAEADRCYLNLGTGEFRDISKASGIDLPTGKGLGIIAWDFLGNGKLGVFAANDSTPNFLFVNDSENPDGVPRFQESALVRGLAVDVDGRPKASMGVAAGDLNRDGHIDLFVTTFMGESNTLFSQRPDGFFDDLSRPFDLQSSGFWMLGFGSQCVDLDGDGWDDLIATNGHVDQQTSRGTPDRMPPQVFHNQQGRRFAEIPRASLGEFFQKDYLGRGLATWDWNRDGRTDMGISHLHDPVAILTNQTPSTGTPLVIRLVGRMGSREPIGATVRVKMKPMLPHGNDARGASTLSGNALPDIVRFLTGGDGYLVTNERRLHFSLPKSAQHVDVEVRWPAGHTEKWTNIAPGQEILLIENRSAPISLSTFPLKSP